MTIQLQLHHSIRAHQDKLWSLSVHKTQPLLATASSDKTCKIFNLSTKQEITSLDDTHKRSIRTVAWKPIVGDDDDEVEPSLACGSFDSTISVWGQDQTEWSLFAVIEGHENEVKCVAWNNSGELLASCSRDKTIWIWEADRDNEEFECISVLQDHTQDVKCVTWHDSLDLLASGSYDDSVRLWREEDDDEDWGCFAELKGHKGTVWGVGFEKGEERLRVVSCSDDHTVKVWKCVDDADEEDVWIEQSTLPSAHQRAVYSVCWSGVSGRIASVGSDGRLVVYEEDEEAGSGKWNIVAVKELAHGVYEVNSVKWFSLQGKEYLITGGDDGVVNIWSI
ncbi:hypothetical protein WICPIJ_006320 [Wickerhamomyces pijperi]|uniref:Probable cytosolic iron-sulfur protein assembly protein 1 n=1 Tax=Wickerhamomyces pijperi TaxID=599730 RepID=A0A9P8TL33_WICPI|nr:hypothetical protein WICPIJ_006320 [Wickerhamomyces pijperi]